VRSPREFCNKGFVGRWCAHFPRLFEQRGFDLSRGKIIADLLTIGIVDRWALPGETEVLGV